MNTKLKSMLASYLAAFLLVSIFTIGCGKTTLAPGGVYQGDKILYQTEKATTGTYDLLHDFVTWEYKYRKVLPVEVSRAADVIRLNSKKWIDSAIALRDAYVAAPSAQSKDKLLTAIAIIEAALSEAASYQTTFKSIAPPVAK